MKNRFLNDYCGGLGKATEESLKEFLGLAVKVAKQGKTDMRKSRICYEIKTGAGELGDCGAKLVKGCSKVIYIPVVNETLEITEQEGFVMDREIFLEILDNCGMIREKTSSKGVRKITIQTFWNRKQNKPHGKGLAKMLDAFYSTEGVDALDCWLEQF